MARFGFRAASSLIWGGWGFAVAFYFFQDCSLGLTTEYRATFPTILIEVARWLGSRFQGIIQMARWLVSRFQGILFKWLVGSAVDSQGILFKWLVGSSVDSQGILFKWLVGSAVDSQV